MSPRLKLRVLPDGESDPSIEAMRAQLGGPVGADGPFAAGDFVRASDVPDARIVLWSDDSHAHLWLGDGRVRKVPVERVSRTDESSAERIALAARVRAFAALEEGRRVTFDAPTGAGEGVLVSHCRLGGLVERDDGVVVAVGFLRFT